MPSTYCFWIKKKKIMMGTTATVVAAIFQVHWVIQSLENWDNPTCIICFFESFIATRGQRYEFQLAKKENMAVVHNAGNDSGNMIFQKICSLLAPSMRAASSSSSGIPRKNCLNKKIPNALDAKGKICD